MDPNSTTPQNDDIDPLEREDQVLPDEETVELAHIEDPEAPEAMAIITQEEQDLHKILDIVTAGVEVVEIAEIPDDKNAPASAVPVKKSGSYTIPRHLIDRELTTEDLFDDGAL